MILAIDTSSVTGSIALGDGGRVIEEQTFTGSGRHSISLFPALENLRLPALPLEKIIVGLGPGSFSGIRVGLAAAQAVAAIKNAEVAGLGSTWSIACQYPEEEQLGIFADARRGEYYVTVFSHGRLTRPTCLIPRDRLAAEAGTMSRAVSAEPIPEVPYRAIPRAADFIRLPPDFPGFLSGPGLEPIYLREAAAPVPSSLQ